MHALTASQILLATCAEQPALAADDRHLIAAFADRGVMARAAIWDDPDEDWASAHAVVLRSTWDYHLRRDQFLEWVDRVSEVTCVFNPPDVVRWNSHKRYLVELAAGGIPTIDSIMISPGQAGDAETQIRARGWTDLVVKPAVSASAHETHRFANDTRGAIAHVRRLAASGDVLVQPHVQELAKYGEMTLMFIGGSCTHAVRRPSRLAHGKAKSEAVIRVTPPAGATKMAEEALGAAYGRHSGAEDAVAAYARVDLAEASGRGWLLLELELIEPSLFFGHAPEAADRLAGVVLRRI